MAQIQSAEKGWGGVFWGLRRCRLQGFLPRDSCRPLCCNHSELQKKAVQPVGLGGKQEAGGPGGFIGTRPAPLWRRLRGTGQAGRGSGGQVCPRVGPARLLGWLQWGPEG